MTVYFGGDLHLGHKNICKFRKGWDCRADHDNYMIDMVYSYAKSKRNTIYLLGDVCFDLTSVEKLARINTNGNIQIVLGNHDTERNLTARDWVDAGFHRLYSLKKYKEFWLSHAPIHGDELRGKKNIHAHTHEYRIDDDRYLCVSVDQTDFDLISLDDIRSIFSNRESMRKFTLEDMQYAI